MKRLNIILLLIFLSISSLSAKDNQESSIAKKHKMTKEEFIKRFLKRRQKTKALNVKLKKEQEKTKNLNTKLKKEQTKTQALEKIRQALEKAKNSKDY